MRFVEVDRGSVTLRYGPVPTPGPGEALVEVIACGICGSDLRSVQGMALPPGVTYPLRPGHEVCGVVRALGPGPVEPAAGTQVVLHGLDPCGRCRWCCAGQEQRCPEAGLLGLSCPGGMADAVAWPASRLVPVAGLDPAQAALLPDAVATAYHALQAASPPAGGALCVLGAGGVGTHVLQLAQALFPDATLAAVVRSDATATRLRKLGIGIVEIGLEGAGRRLLGAVNGGFDAVVDFSGQPGAPREGVRALARGGRLVLGSVVDEEIRLGTTGTGMAIREYHVVGSYASTLEDLRTVTRLVSEGRLDLSSSVSRSYPLVQAPKAFADLAERTGGVVRFVLEPGR